MANIQVFDIDKTAVQGSSAVFFTGVNLYFKKIPKRYNNASGIHAPGVSVYLCLFRNNIPDPTQKLVGSTATVDYDSIQVSDDGSVATLFAPIHAPIRLNTDHRYGIVIKPEDPGFELWTNTAGDILVDNNNISTGTVSQGVRRYFEYTNAQNIKHLIGVHLKFDVQIAKFTANTATINLVPSGYEFINLPSGNNTNFMGGELVFQDYSNATSNVTFNLPGTININAGNNVIVGTNTNFTVFSSNDYIVITGGTNKNVLKVNNVTNSTFLTLNGTPTFTRASGNYKKTAIGSVYKYDPIGNLLILKDSNANTSVFFNSKGVLNYVINTPGNNYNNADFIIVSGGGATKNATANIITNGNGAIVGINVSNAGIGFTTNGTLTIANSTGGTANGTGANVTVTGYGSYIVGPESGVISQISSLKDYPVHQFDAQIMTMIPSTGIVSATHNFSNTTYSVVNNNIDNTTLPGFNTLNYDGIIMSRSNEVLNNANLFHSNSSAIIQTTLQTTNTNSTFDSPLFYKEKIDVFVLSNEINNTANNEWLPQGGNAISKHITTQIHFANNVLAEDLILYVNAYKPPNTDIQVYAKIYNSSDNDSFSDKYWTPMVQTDPNTSIYSTSNNTNSVLQFTYNLPSLPPIQNTITGFITASNNSNIITGVGTNFSTDLVVGGLIKLYDPNLPNTSYMVAMVTGITNSTSATIDSAITNNSILFSGTGTTSGIGLSNLTLDNTAFLNNQNYNIVRYYNSSLAAFDTYDTVQFKLVFLSSSNNVVPIVSSIQGLGVSA
jgi:hypothetical protein